MKKYKNGLVLGKFYGLHLGHLYLIDTALENCEKINIIICSNKSQFIPGELRLNVIKEIYKNNKNVIVHHIDDELLPQYDYECKTLDEFYGYWVPEVYKKVSDLDVVFTSENYGDDFAKYLGVEHYMVDIERKKYPISGTKIRNNTFENWNFIPDEMKAFFIKRVAILGPESVGKSVLSEKLASHFNTNFVVEYGRTVYENNGNNISIDDFIPISEGRQVLENSAIKKSNKILFCDTEDITTYLFSKMFYPNEYKSIENWFIDKIKKQDKYDIYILLKPDCPAMQDGTRLFLNSRWEHYTKIKNELLNQNCNFIEVGGKKWKDRFEKCIEIIKSNFNI